jgi:hypothetical protein
MSVGRPSAEAAGLVVPAPARRASRPLDRSIGLLKLLLLSLSLSSLSSHTAPSARPLPPPPNNNTKKQKPWRLRSRPRLALLVRPSAAPSRAAREFLCFRRDISGRVERPPIYPLGISRARGIACGERYDARNLRALSPKDTPASSGSLSLTRPSSAPPCSRARPIRARRARCIWPNGPPLQRARSSMRTEGVCRKGRMSAQQETLSPLLSSLPPLSPPPHPPFSLPKRETPQPRPRPPVPRGARHQAADHAAHGPRVPAVQRGERPWRFFLSPARTPHARRPRGGLVGLVVASRATLLTLQNPTLGQGRARDRRQHQRRVRVPRALQLQARPGGRHQRADQVRSLFFFAGGVFFPPRGGRSRGALLAHTNNPLPPPPHSSQKTNSIEYTVS